MRHADGAADDVGLGQRRVEDAVARRSARCRPCVTLKTPPLPGTWRQRAVAAASATSSPKTTMRGLCAISSFSVRLMAATIVSGLPVGLSRACRRRRTVGSTSGENTQSAAVSAAASAPRARRRWPRRSRGRPTAAIAARSSSVASPSPSRSARIRTSGSRARLGLALRRRLVQPLVVGQRVRVRARDLGVHERRLALAAHPRDGLAAASRSCRGSRVPSQRRTFRFGKRSTSREMSPPGVCTSTGTEIA